MVRFVTDKKMARTHAIKLAVIVASILMGASPAYAQADNDWDNLSDKQENCPISNRIRVVDWGSLSDISGLRDCRSQIVEGRAKIVAPAPPPVRIEAPVPDGRSFGIAKQRPAGARDAARRAGTATAFNTTWGARSASINDIIEDVGARHRVDPRLLHAVIAVESGYRPASVSPVGARGLMQLMPATARSLGVAPATLFDPATNIDAGARLLRRLNGRYAGDLSLILAAYNAGEGAVDRYSGAIPPYRETVNYVDKVISKYKYLIESAN